MVYPSSLVDYYYCELSGDANDGMFNIINEAYSALLLLQTEEDDRENSDIVEYEIEVKKGVKGLGITVSDMRIPGKLVVSAPVMTTSDMEEENIIVESMSCEAEEGVRVGDILVGIDCDDCSHWLFSRVRARLGLERVKVGEVVCLAFQRRVPKAVVASADGHGHGGERDRESHHAHSTVHTHHHTQHRGSHTE